jgi:N-acyl-D-amino-acid deacylase
MAYDLIIKNGKIIDGSGLPGFHGDVAVSGGRIVEIGRVSGAARRVIDADGLVVAPGIIDNHTHYDAQVTWDPLCTYSCYHGITTVVIGNCSLAVWSTKWGVALFSLARRFSQSMGQEISGVTVICPENYVGPAV